jgi:DNA-binding XRE family transcriptional regulator
LTLIKLCIIFVSEMDEKEQKYLYESVGDNIKKFRNESGVNQQELANKLGLSRVSIVNIEKGRQHPSLHLLISIGRLFNVQLEDFLPKDLSKIKIEKRSIKTELNKELRSLTKKSGEKFENEKIMNFIMNK